MPDHTPTPVLGSPAQPVPAEPEEEYLVYDRSKDENGSFQVKQTGHVADCSGDDAPETQDTTLMKPIAAAVFGLAKCL